MKFYNPIIQIFRFVNLFFVLFLSTSELLIAEQKIFTTPEEASDYLYKAVEQKNSTAISLLFGVENMHLLPIDDIDAKDLEKFVNSWKLSNQFIALKNDEIYIVVGKGAWIFPIPLVKGQHGWFFDTGVGDEIIRIRRIGYNELSAMQFVLAYYAAQIEYTTKDRNHNDSLEYAQKFISSNGKHDGLFWNIQADEKPSPLSLLSSQSDPEKGLRGYYYKILKAQGNNATAGAYNYLRGNKMTSGFALIAWPVEYANSGISSFVINHQGVMYEKNLGPDTSETAAKMKVFNPDKSWRLSVAIP